MSNSVEVETLEKQFKKFQNKKTDNTQSKSSKDKDSIDIEVETTVKVKESKTKYTNFNIYFDEKDAELLAFCRKRKDELSRKCLLGGKYSVGGILKGLCYLGLEQYKKKEE